MTMSRVAVALVTHNGERWLPAVLSSISLQTRTPDTIVVVDDHSTDGTLALLREHGIDAVPAETRLGDSKARTGANFEQAVRIAQSRRMQLVALGDQDDVWHEDRIAHQAWLMDERRDLAMLASDGLLVNEAGEPNGQSLRSAFPLPQSWWQQNPAQQMSSALRSSVATGGASMVRPENFGDALTVPCGWLHDRWWSLAALAMNAFKADDRMVIDYRLSTGQQVGLDSGSQQASGADRLLTVAGAPSRLASRFHDVRGLARFADPNVASSLTPVAVMRGFIGR